MQQEQLPAHFISELSLTEGLPTVWKKRFETAFHYMWDNLANSPTWQEVADHCAVSPYHFHRMFNAVFKQTPGQYLSRLKLQMAARLLFHNYEISVLDVALECGFSSSQALAKALKKDLKLTAKKIRQLSQEQDIETMMLFLERLGSPATQGQATLEQQMASELSFQIVHYEQRYCQTKLLQPATMPRIWHQWSKLKKHNEQDVVMLTPLNQSHKAYAEQDLYIGLEVGEGDPASQIIEAGYFLCCRIKTNTEVGYFSAWEAIYKHLMSSTLEPLENGYIVEHIHNKGDDISSFTDMTLAIPIYYHDTQE